MKLIKNFAALVLVMLLGGLRADPAAAGLIFDFRGITNNNVVDVGIGEAQLSVDVSDAGGGKVAFKFVNSGPDASSITAVYFDDSALLGGASIVNGPGVRFSPGAAPPNLPGGNSIGFDTSFATDSDSPVSPNGVNPGEFLIVVFSLGSGKTYLDAVRAMHDGVDLRIGLKVQAFAGGGSESFVNNPEPATVLLLGLGLVGLALTRRRRRRAL